jgi:glycosyltransferase involved in cell wall biosynthesis
MKHDVWLKPKISVCMATFNGEKYILDQILSILEQLSEVDELIISDDCSTDNTVKVIKCVDDNRIEICHSQNVGVVRNFENAILNSTGDIIVLCDQDDVWLPGRLNVVVNSLVDFDLAVVGYEVVDSDLNPIESNMRLPSLSVLRTLFKNGYLGCCMAFRRSITHDLLPFPKGVAMHDWWIAIMSLVKHRVVIISDVYVMYRRHGSNASSTGNFSKNSLTKKCLIRMHMVFFLLLRVAGLR